ncbi:MAG: hypothetical protein Crog4KO_05630 [Crocinitomicaceae bacterium]
MSNWILHIVFVGLALQVQSQCSCDSLIAAIQLKDQESVTNCLASGTDPNCFIREYVREENYAPLKREHSYYVFEWYNRPMVYAIRENNLEMVKMLHEAGASINSGGLAIRDTLGSERGIQYDVPLTLAKQIIEKKEDSTIYNYLIKEGSEPFTVQWERGKVFDSLFFSYRLGRNGIQALQQMQYMITKHGDAIIMPYENGQLNDAIFDNLEFVIKWLIDIRGIKPWKFEGEKLFLYVDGISLRDLIYGRRITIETIDYLCEIGVTSLEEIKSTLSNKYFRKRHFKYWKYYTLYFKKEATEKPTKKERLTRKMEKIRKKLYDQNHWENRAM